MDRQIYAMYAGILIYSVEDDDADAAAADDDIDKM